MVASVALGILGVAVPLLSYLRSAPLISGTVREPKQTSSFGKKKVRFFAIRPHSSLIHANTLSDLIIVLSCKIVHGRTFSLLFDTRIGMFLLSIHMKNIHKQSGLAHQRNS